jgi:hypothetical protein
MQELQDRAVSAAETGSAEELLRVRKEIVDLHGEMVLLENYSALNYTGEHCRPLLASCLVMCVIEIWGGVSLVTCSLPCRSLEIFYGII